jgi:pimeloyl-ACP methyl ester carboxylesterase
MREHVLDTPDGELFAVDAGAGTPILMLHGWPLDHRMFRGQIADLARDFRVIAPDRRGFGRSTAPASMLHELDDIDLWLDRLALDAVHLLGVSQGGRIALRYAATRRQRLRSLLLQGAAVDGVEVAEPPHERLPLERYVALARDGRLGEAMADWLAHPMMQLPAASRAERELLADIVAGYRGGDLVNYAPAEYRFDQPVLPAIGASALPLLLLTGASETAARKQHAKVVLNAVKSARECVIPGAGHLANLEQPAHFNAAVREFCRQADSLVA